MKNYHKRATKLSTANEKILNEKQLREKQLETKTVLLIKQSNMHILSFTAVQ